MPAQIIKVGSAIYPSVKVRGYKVDPKTKKKKFGIIKQILFGDFIKPEIKNGKYITIIEDDAEYIKVRIRGYDGYIKPSEIQPNRVMEVNFVDIGQGDGCHVATPDDKHFIIDAGPSDNMYRFLKWRFNLKNAKLAPPPFDVIITHSDADHYMGFGHLFSKNDKNKQQFTINNIYHNGLVELSGTPVDTLGTLVEHKGKKYITGLCDTNAQYKKRAESVEKPGQYIACLNKSKAPKKSLRKGSDPIYANGNIKIEVIGPVAEKIKGEDGLEVFGANKGKTKNGHSVVLLLTIGKLKVLLGGDLNSLSEDHLLSHYSKTDIASLRKEMEKAKDKPAELKKLQNKMNDAIMAARKTFEVDVAKSCHHGSHDFTSEFMQAVNPLATVVSSGDEEPHCHPRPDTLGTIGKYSRGERSLIFCTELARSSKEFVEFKLTKKDPEKENKNKKDPDVPEGEEKTSIRQRAVTVYGMINLRTDGEKVIIAQMLERPAAGRNWDIHKIEFNEETGEFEYKQFKKE